MEIFPTHPSSTNTASQAAHPAVQQPRAAASSGSGGASSGTAGSTSITANDFLSLLVAEMKNQDPTADSDPNAYINQLVQVNSLQQLIQINQDLGGGATGSVAHAVSPLEARLRQNAGAAPSAAHPDPASRLATALADQSSADRSTAPATGAMAAPFLHS